jgi:secondary thiamine-phosphate synthase enzyme
MTYRHSAFKILSDSRPTFHDVTRQAIQEVESSGIRNGLLTVYSQHTTCAVLIQEQSDDVDLHGTQFVLQDMVNGLSKVFPTCEREGQYLHPGPEHIRIASSERGEEAWWSLNTDAHLRSVMLGRSVTVPIINGEAQLGEFGRIYFADFDQLRARERNVIVTVLGEEA